MDSRPALIVCVALNSSGIHLGCSVPCKYTLDSGVYPLLDLWILSGKSSSLIMSLTPLYTTGTGNLILNNVQRPIHRHGRVFSIMSSPHIQWLSAAANVCSLEQLSVGTVIVTLWHVWSNGTEFSYHTGGVMKSGVTSVCGNRDNMQILSQLTIVLNIWIPFKTYA